MKYLQLKEIDVNKYDAIGFDMDGTLYEECEFIEQAYLEIVNILNLQPKQKIYQWMLERWSEKGSSYPYIFEEMLSELQIKNVDVSDILGVYRNVKPILKLNDTISYVLKEVDCKKLFLITDGNSCLQRNKFLALRLDKIFLKDNCGFTGDLGPEFYKPNLEVIKGIKCLKNPVKSVLFFGDRVIDEQFATNAKFDFALVSDFKKFWGV